MTGPAKKPAVHVVGAGDRKAIEALFGARGACAGCWCMHWRLERGGQLWRDMQGEPNKREFFKLLAKDQHPRRNRRMADGEPVGWCSFGPRSDFPKLERSRVFHRAEPRTRPGRSSVFSSRRAGAAQGMATALLRAATKEALRRGASEIEGLPALHPQGARRSPPSSPGPAWPRCSRPRAIARSKAPRAVAFI